MCLYPLLRAETYLSNFSVKTSRIMMFSVPSKIILAGNGLGDGCRLNSKGARRISELCIVYIALLDVNVAAVAELVFLFLVREIREPVRRWIGDRNDSLELLSVASLGYSSKRDWQ